VESAETSGETRFGAELRAHRAARAWTQVKLGDEIGYSGSFVSDVERGERSPSDDFAKRCDTAFELPGTFWRLYEDLQRDAFPTWFAPILPIQREATKITGWELGAVPGLLQTEGYARALIRARKPHDDEEAVERTLRARMDRQEILSRPKAPKLWYVLSEAVLRQCIGGPEVMAGQLDKLLKAAETPGWVIQVLPFSAQANAGTDGSIYLYDRPSAPVVAYCEMQGGARLIDDPAEISDLTTVMGMLRAAALPPWDSTALMRTIRRSSD
jgi:transcriptional regulator with XRE-family HTH domain